MQQAKIPAIRVPKEYANQKRLVAVPEALYKEAIRRKKKEEKEVLEIVRRAEKEYREGKTTHITSADQLNDL